jgi:hypothetical protein
MELGLVRFNVAAQRISEVEDASAPARSILAIPAHATAMSDCEESHPRSQ